jgi:hypothetical protein
MMNMNALELITASPIRHRTSHTASSSLQVELPLSLCDTHSFTVVFKLFPELVPRHRRNILIVRILSLMYYN